MARLSRLGTGVAGHFGAQRRSDWSSQASSSMAATEPIPPFFLVCSPHFTALQITTKFHCRIAWRGRLPVAMNADDGGDGRPPAG
jgi:hypothetical protein